MKTYKIDENQLKSIVTKHKCCFVIIQSWPTMEHSYNLDHHHHHQWLYNPCNDLGRLTPEVS
jgi:hypothetical protein